MTGVDERGSSVLCRKRSASIHSLPRKDGNYVKVIGGACSEHQQLSEIADSITNALATAAQGEAIQLCGLYLLQCVSSDPSHVLVVARQAIESYHFQHVPTHWRRIYEEASLYRTAALLRVQSDRAQSHAKARKKYRADGDDSCEAAEDWLQDVIGILDQAMMFTGAPGRRVIFDMVFSRLQVFATSDDEQHVGSAFHVHPIPEIAVKHSMQCVSEPPTLKYFERWIQGVRTPLVIQQAIDHWPACQRWQDPRYLLRKTLGGRRIVPVEMGESYTSQNWTQRTMTMKDFMVKYLLPQGPEEIGYLAQYDLFDQIPALRADVSIPDYCYATAPNVDEESRKTSGLAAALPVDEPLMHAWLGPKGTKTPLHTDPNHNLFCQVVGYKYVRLYAPHESKCLYPRGVDDSGINMENTSGVDVSFLGPEHDAEKLRVKFPLFETAKYQEAVLGPGEMLYVPLGWWHYVESLTVSFSVSFWWN
ncbi:hypothetical protein LTR62_001077 [Meristemomyces frigidus]|uniref:JmjC domain-containing protein n=1 Tax=Meristemomyces frigidus TaxID=1508187 RepID=A0AAN7TBW3_9PEZI|nr:hypothetical protein LTR62_001077 [Meristemomyces frigidus]